MNIETGLNEHITDINIGMMGLVINNGNMGCVALTYSFIKIMEEISDRFINIRFIYNIFEDMPDKQKIRTMCKIMHLNDNQVVSIKYKKSLFQLRDINVCDIVFDFTEGDSFSDIYGNKRFIKNFFYKKLVLLSDTKLILGPQTIGPFIKKINKCIARNIIEHSDLLFSRDKESIDYVHSFSNAKILLTTDIAFKLPYYSIKKVNNSQKKIGFNASKLLYFREYDSKRIHLSLDFKRYSQKLIKKLIEMGYTVFLISHVNGDYEANMDIHLQFPQTILVNKFSNPVEAKTEISKMDFMVSPRMHATIAAYSVGIFVIPLSYSRKFRSLFNEIGLKNIIDMEYLDTDTAVSLTIEYIHNPRKYILNYYNNERIGKKINVFYNAVEQLIKEIINE